MQLQPEKEYEVSLASGAQQALAICEKRRFSPILADLKMPGMLGLELLRRVRAGCPDTAVLIVTAFGSIQGAVEALKSGAADYITKPIDYDELLLVVRRAVEHQDLIREVREFRTTLDRKYGLENIIGRSNSLLNVLDMAARAARSGSTVLITGETGTGKELLARAVHFNSRRKDKPYVTINCGAIPKHLMESELLGHVKGSFTGAVAHKRRKVETADTGTLFLDEIGEMPFELQVKQLRLIQSGKIEKTAAPRRAVWMSASLPPPLIPCFQRYTWPGNVRELENVVERLVVLCRGAGITAADLPDCLKREREAPDASGLDLLPNGISMEAVEKDLILRALKEPSWNGTRAAKCRDISRKALVDRMEKHGIRRAAEDATPASDEDDWIGPENGPRVALNRAGPGAAG